MKQSKVLNWIDLHLEECICVLCLIALSCIMMLQIILRYVFSHSLPWAEEFCRYCFIYAALLGTGYVIRHKKILRVDIIVSLLPPVLGKLILILGEVVSLIFYVLFIYASLMATMKLYQINQLSPAMQIPMWTIYLAGPLGFLAGAIRTLQQIIFLIRDFNQKEASA